MVRFCLSKMDVLKRAGEMLSYTEMPLAGGDNNGTFNGKSSDKYTPLTKCSPEIVLFEQCR